MTRPNPMPFRLLILLLLVLCFVLLNQHFSHAKSAGVTQEEATLSQGPTVTQQAVPNAPAATFTVSSLQDNGSGSLRQAVLDANAAGGVDTIVFSALFNSPQTITLTNGEMAINQGVIIVGTGANLLTVSGNNVSRIFRVGFGVTGVLISDMTIANGRAGDVGGGIVSDGDLTMSNCVFTNNTSAPGFSGGGVYQAGGIGYFAACSFTGNTAAGGGGLEIINASATIADCTISGNQATATAGGVEFQTIGGGGSKTLTISNSTIVNNVSPGTGGLRTTSNGGVAAAAALQSSIIANNSTNNLESSGGATATITSHGFNLSDNWNGVATLGTDKTAQPLLGPLALNGGRTPTHALLGGSPALNAGSNPLSFLFDQRGLPRVNGASADIGAFEAQAVVVTNALDSGSGSLRDAITNSPTNSDILFDPAFFNVARTITLGGTELVINKNLTISGPGANLLTITGNNVSRVFSIAAGFNVSLSGMTITGGNGAGTVASGSGGGIFNNAGTLTLANSTISGNTATFGGGIRNFTGGTLIVINTTISGNTANDNGLGTCGGIDSSGNLTVTNSTISGNRAPNGNNNGGGIWSGGVSSTTANITNSTITNNSAGGATSASGVFRYNGTVTIRNSIVAGNANSANQPDVVADDGTGITSNGYNLIGNPGTVTFNGTGDQKGTPLTPLNPNSAHSRSLVAQHRLTLCSAAVPRSMRGTVLASRRTSADGLVRLTLRAFRMCRTSRTSARSRCNRWSSPTPTTMAAPEVCAKRS